MGIIRASSLSSISSNSGLLTQETKPISEGEAAAAQGAPLLSGCSPEFHLPPPARGTAPGRGWEGEFQIPAEIPAGIWAPPELPSLLVPESLLQPLISDSRLPPGPAEHSPKRTPPVPGSFLSQAQQNFIESFILVTKSRTLPAHSKTCSPSRLLNAVIFYSSAPEGIPAIAALCWELPRCPLGSPGHCHHPASGNTSKGNSSAHERAMRIY